MLVPFNFSGPTAPRHLQLAPPTSWLRPQGMPVGTDLRLFSTLVIYLCLFPFLGILTLGSIVYASTEHTCTHTQDQGWERRGPSSSQECSELWPLSPHAIHTATPERDGSLFKLPALSSSTRWHPPTLSARRRESFPKGETIQLPMSRKKWLGEAEVSLSHPQERK